MGEWLLTLSRLCVHLPRHSARGRSSKTRKMTSLTVLFRWTEKAADGHIAPASNGNGRHLTRLTRLVVAPKSRLPPWSLRRTCPRGGSQFPSPQANTLSSRRHGHQSIPPDKLYKASVSSSRGL